MLVWRRGERHRRMLIARRARRRRVRARARRVSSCANSSSISSPCASRSARAEAQHGAIEARRVHCASPDARRRVATRTVASSRATSALNARRPAGGDAKPAFAGAVVSASAGGLSSALNPSLLGELVERAVERDGPELQRTVRELEYVSHDAGAVSVALGEGEEDEEPVSAHDGVADYIDEYNSQLY